MPKNPKFPRTGSYVRSPLFPSLELITGLATGFLSSMVAEPVYSKIAFRGFIFVVLARPVSVRSPWTLPVGGGCRERGPGSHRGLRFDPSYISAEM